MKKIIIILMIVIFCCAFCYNSNKEQGIEFYEYKTGVFIVELDTKKNLTLEPYVAETLELNSSVFKKENAKLVVNAGFFDAKNKKTTSYVVKNYDIVANPELNENLTTNVKLEKYLNQIYNRSEFRILKCKDNLKYDISQHNEAVQANCQILHSIQAGPQLLPTYQPQKEAFLDYENDIVIRDAISCLKKAPRTAIGLKKSKIYIIIATKNSPLTLLELHNLAKELKLEKAMGFDGGGSTSLNYKNIEIVSEKDNKARRVKSFLVVK